MDIKFDPTAVLTNILTEKSAKIAFAALIIDLLLTATAVGLLVGTGYKDHWLTTTEAGIVAGCAIVGFAVIWFILYLQTREELTDVYTLVRKQISGRWLVKYATSPNYGEVEERFVSCDIQEDTLLKLEMKFTIVQSPIFSPQEPNVVKDIALRLTDSGYKLFYYFETKRALASNIVELLPPNDSRRGEVEIETLGMLEFDRPASKKDKVQEMRGKWYDLNGNMMRLMKLLQMAEEAKLRNIPFDRIAFDEIPVSQIHFDADMGPVTFSYQGQK